MSNPTLNFNPNKPNHVIPQSFTCYPNPTSRRSRGREGSHPTALTLDLPHLILLPSVIMSVWYYGICTEKNSVSIQLATNKTNTTCHSGLSQTLPSHPFSTNTPSPPSPTSHAGLLHHPIYIFIGQLSPSLPSLSGSSALSNGGNLSHSLIERLWDYGEVRNKVVLRNHKHKPFHSLC